MHTNWKLWAIALSITIVALFVYYQGYDPYYDPFYTMNASEVIVISGFSEEEFTAYLRQSLPYVEDAWARGDMEILLARLTGEKRHYRAACHTFEHLVTPTKEGDALRFETLASLNCSGAYRQHLQQAAYLWKEQGMHWRAILLTLALQQLPFSFDTSHIAPTLSLDGATRIMIGNTTIRITENDTVVTQVDRVYRDWLGQQLAQSPFSGDTLVTFSERLTFSPEELREDIGWHEGGRIRDLQRLNVPVVPVTGTLHALHEGRWYAPDAEGIFRYEVPHDKVWYPTTRFLTENLVSMIDTHGANMLVEQAIRMNATHVLACCDYWGKAKAAQHLADVGIEIICITDRYVPLLMGHDVPVVGSPIWRVENDTMIYGNAPIILDREHRVVVTDAAFGEVYALQYYDTPARYFATINETFPLDIITVELTDFGQLDAVFATAREHDAHIVGTRIFSKEDYAAAHTWLSENSNNTLVMFHSTTYPSGILIMQEFPEQVSFNDPNVLPLFEST